MKVRKGVDGGWFVVFPSNLEAERWEWLFLRILRRPISCFGQYENAYRLT